MRRSYPSLYRRLERGAKRGEIFLETNVRSDTHQFSPT